MIADSSHESNRSSLNSKVVRVDVVKACVVVEV
jgi:hypothetical protein